MNASIAPQPISQDVLRDRYAQAGEHTVDDVRQRIAAALAQAEAPSERAGWAARFLAAQRGGFIPAGRIAANAGSGLRATLVNCFVQPVGDSIRHDEPGRPAIYTALAEAAETLRQGGGVGFDFSRIRPRGARVAGSRCTAAGPLAFLPLFEASCHALGEGSARGCAQMAVLRCDHPDIEAFIDAKAGGGLAHFNLSVGITDAFMAALEDDRAFDLVHVAEPSPAQRSAGAVQRGDGAWLYRRVRAAALWQRLVDAAHRVGEPGVLFLDRVRDDDNLGYCETLEATNPCGEQPLPPYGGCCLGSIDLTRLVERPFAADAHFDFERFDALVPTAVRMLDDVLDVTAWPLPQQREQALATRRVGLGLTGLGDALAMLGLRYDGPLAREWAARVARHLRDGAYAASADLALERGAFARFDAAGMLRPGTCASRLPEALQARVRRDGLRNSHLLSLAPAGSVSLAFADNVSSGIEPAYAWRALRHRRMSDGSVRAYEVEDHAWRLHRRLAGDHAPLPAAFVSALSLSAADHLAMVAAIAPFVDGAVSKTVNAPAACTLAEFEALFRAAWRHGLKGVTAFRPNPVLGAALHAAESLEPAHRHPDAMQRA